jgi:two-component system LytT family sensor kinase
MDIDRLFQSRRTQFWALQLLGWSGWGFTFYLAAIVWASHVRYSQYMPMAAAMGLIISLGLRQIYRYTWDYQPRHRIAVALVASAAAGVLWRMGRETVFGHLFVQKEKLMMELQGWDLVFVRLPEFVTAWMVMLSWTGLYFGIKYYQLLQEERERGLKSEAMAHEAQLKMLRYQLNPHSLFNTLNAISTLVLDKDNTLANTMLTRLSHFLRYSLDNDPMQKVSLAQEIEAVQLYLDIEKVRFDERLQLQFEIEEAAKSALIPSLLLQPLAENAIKYAIAQSIKGGTIKIAARVFAGELLLEVSDDGPGLDSDNGKGKGKGNGGASPRRGVGLVNTRERLQELYGKNHSFRLAQTDPHGVTIHIRIPLELESSP